MAYLHEDRQTFNAAVARTADQLRINPAIVAKDYFVYVMLKEIVVRYPSIVFKGGTCLSKCHKVINRFSEDIDLGVETEQLSQGEHKKVKNAIVEAAAVLGLAIPNIDETRSRRDFNKYVIQVPFDLSAPGLGKDLLVETAFMTPASPAIAMPAGNFIHDVYSALPDGDALLDAFALAPFELNATSIERSFVDKVFALCDYFLGERPAERCSRHIYDEYKLLEHVSLNVGMADLFVKVRCQRQGLPYCISAERAVDIPATLREIVRTGYYESDYKAVTKSLLWEDVPYETAIMSLSIIADFLDGTSSL